MYRSSSWTECIELTYTVDAAKIPEDQAGAVTAAIWLCRRIWRWFWSFIDQLHYWRRPPQLEHVMNDHTICVESGRLNYFKAFATDEVIRFNDNQVTSAWLVPGTEQN